MHVKEILYLFQTRVFTWFDSTFAMNEWHQLDYDDATGAIYALPISCLSIYKWPTSSELRHDLFPYFLWWYCEYSQITIQLDIVKNNLLASKDTLDSNITTMSWDAPIYQNACETSKKSFLIWKNSRVISRCSVLVPNSNKHNLVSYISIFYSCMAFYFLYSLKTTSRIFTPPNQKGIEIGTEIK